MVISKGLPGKLSVRLKGWRFSRFQQALRGEGTRARLQGAASLLRAKTLEAENLAVGQYLGNIRRRGYLPRGTVLGALAFNENDRALREQSTVHRCDSLKAPPCPFRQIARGIEQP